VGVRIGLLVVLVLVAGSQSTAAPLPDRVEFTAVGDFSSSSQAASVMTAIKDSGSDLTMALGDLSYGTTGQEQTWCDFVTSRVGTGYPFELLSGNHESNGQNGNINDFSACLPNQLPGVVGTYGRQYYVDAPQSSPLVRFIQISPALPFPDTTWSYAAGTSRYNWTAAAIDGARAAGVPWVVVGMHKPCLTIGVYTCEPGADLLNLLLSKKVDLVLAGHEHGYQRTHQLRLGPSCPSVVPGAFNAACVGDSDSEFTSGAGTVFGIVGTGGVALRDNNTADVEAGYMAASSGSNQNPTWGPLDVVATPTSMRADFLRAAGGTFADGFTLTKDSQTPNEPPGAAFTSSCTGLTCSVDGTGSSDGDGTVAGYAWDFGDGGTASGATASHTYAVAGSYSVRLTVTDDDGSTATTTRTVTATEPPTGVTFASDDFSRTATSGFGTAPVGGTWTHSTSLTNFSVTGGQGQMRTANGSEPKAYLATVNAPQVDLRTRLSLDKLPVGGSNYLTILGRRIPTAGSYAAKIVIRATGATTVELTREPTGGSEVTMQGQTAVPGTYAVGDAYNIRLQVTGSAPTTIRAKVWEVGTTEPTTWQRSVTDTTAAMQNSGSIGITNYLSSGATNSPLLLRIDDLTVTQP